MSATELHGPPVATRTSRGRHEDSRWRSFPCPTSDRSKEFYERLGWRLDDDVAPLGRSSDRPGSLPPAPGLRFDFGLGLTTGAPRLATSALVVSDIEAPMPNWSDGGIESE